MSEQHGWRSSKTPPPLRRDVEAPPQERREPRLVRSAPVEERARIRQERGGGSFLPRQRRRVIDDPNPLG